MAKVRTIFSYFFSAFLPVFLSFSLVFSLPHSILLTRIPFLVLCHDTAFYFLLSVSSKQCLNQEKIKKKLRKKSNRQPSHKSHNIIIINSYRPFLSISFSFLLFLSASSLLYLVLSSFLSFNPSFCFFFLLFHSNKVTLSKK